MSKDGLVKIMADLRAKSLTPKPTPVALPLLQTNAKPLPWADILPPKTEWEKAMDEVQGKPVLRLGKRGTDLNTPYFYKGVVSSTERLSSLPEGEQTVEAKRVALKAEAKAELLARVEYKGGPQQRIALNNALAKIKRGQKLTLGEIKLVSAWNIKRIGARLGLDLIQPKGVSNAKTVL